MLTVMDDMVHAVHQADPTEESVHAALDAECEGVKKRLDDLTILGMLTYTQYALVDRYGKATYAQKQRGKRVDPNLALKVSAVKSYTFKKYKSNSYHLPRSA